MTVIAEPLDSHRTFVGKRAWPSVASALAWGLIVIGAVLRVARWIHWRSLWLDEIYLTNSIVTRSLHALLFTPLDDWQAAPPGFLVLEHLVVKLLGAGERALRLVSLLFGLASLPLALAVARRTLSPRAAVVAIAFFVFLGPLIYYCNEVKPYSCDVAFSLAITLATLRLIERPSPGRAIAAGLVGVVGILFSFPAVFVIAGAVLMLALHWREMSRSRGVWIVCACWGAALLGEFLLFLRPFAHGETHWHLVAYWRALDAFAPTSLPAAVIWLFTSLVAIAHSPGAMWLACPDAAVAALLIGVALALRRRGNLLILLAPLPFVLLASRVRQYPFADRLVLFLVPQFLMLMAAGLEALWINFAGKVAALVLGGLILLPPAQRACLYLLDPPGREETLPAYRWIARQWRNGDTIYLTPFARLSFHYYQSQAGFPTGADPSAAAIVQPNVTDVRDILTGVNQLAGRPRVWVVLAHADGFPIDVPAVTLSAFDEIGHPCARHIETGATVYLYDCSAPIR